MLRYIACSLAMFSRVPIPRSLNLSEDDMRYILAAFPLVGVFIGAIALLWWWLCGVLELSALLRAVGFACVPFLVAGAIHMDGFVDVCDAISSHASPAKKRKILADPHVGAFAIICTVLYLLVYCAVLFELDITLPTIGLIACIYVFERALSGMCALMFPKSSDKGMLATFSREASEQASMLVLAIIFVVCVVCMVLLDWVSAIFAVIAAAIAVVYLYVTARKQFGGMSGDLSGFFLQIAELAMIIALLVAQKVVLFL
ncbi:MAG: adenosylcobinamide-GDP ribazoletransferase [Eggerthellaceae bacterium]|nr:adenosylcobinamide-GDP ribazoletransferase [Eggerthellaceae bacterium]